MDGVSWKRKLSKKKVRLGENIDSALERLAALKGPRKLHREEEIGKGDQSSGKGGIFRPSRGTFGDRT